MGTTARPRTGYFGRELDRWAGRAQSWAKAGRDVYLYVISGEKVATRPLQWP